MANMEIPEVRDDDLTADVLRGMIDNYKKGEGKKGRTALERNLLPLAMQLARLQDAVEEAWRAAD